MLPYRIGLDAPIARRELSLDGVVEPLRRRRQQPVAAGLLEAAGSLAAGAQDSYGSYVDAHDGEVYLLRSHRLKQQRTS